jgi:hypothetical protein
MGARDRRTAAAPGAVALAVPGALALVVLSVLLFLVHVGPGVLEWLLLGWAALVVGLTALVWRATAR